MDDTETIEDMDDIEEDGIEEEDDGIEDDDIDDEGIETDDMDDIDGTEESDELDTESMDELLSGWQHQLLVSLCVVLKNRQSPQKLLPNENMLKVLVSTPSTLSASMTHR